MAAGPSVIVVGGGIIGLCAAYYCRQRGMRVTLLERGGPGHHGCSWGNAGMVVPSHFVPLAAPGMVGLGLRMLLNPEGPFAIRPRADLELAEWAWRFCRSATARHVARSAPLLRDLGLASRAAFEELAGELDDFGLTRRGLLMYCKEKKTLHEEAAIARQAHALGIPAEVLSPEEARRLDPGLQLDAAGAVYFPHDSHLDSGRLLDALVRRLEAGGTDFRWHTETVGWRVRDGRIAGVTTPGGELHADEYVVAGGSWSAALLRDLGLRLPLQAGKGYSVTLPDASPRPALCSILVEARVAVTPMGRALRFAGTLELGGADLSVNRRRLAGMLRSVGEYFPDFPPERLRELPVWSGLRPCSPDGLPYVGRTRRVGNLCIATGHAMLGVSLGPITGMLVAAALAGEPHPFDLRPLSPDRYG